jgi:ankyrin repeat protein
MYLYALAFGCGFVCALAVAASASDRKKDHPLHIACRKGNVKSVKMLLDSGADPNVFNYFGQTPLLLACTADNSAIVKMLLDKNADAIERIKID